MTEFIPPEEHRRQIQAYAAEQPIYRTFADALKRVLERACKAELPAAVIQARPKSASSFAEKCVRRFDKYPDAIRQMTDLCGARVVVQTLDQVKAVRAFVEANFRVVETEDIGLRLGGREFGYRDRHYIVQLESKRAAAVGFMPEEIAAIDGRKAELQIRTWAQHTWADTLHDRTYKSPVKLTAEAWRTAALLAALMEDGDRNFDRLANELDGTVTNYSSYGERKKVEEEIELQGLLAGNEKDPTARVALDFHRARLHGVLGQYEEVIALLEPHAGAESPLLDEVQLELGTALCRQHRGEPASEVYQRGIGLIADVKKRLAEPQGTVVLNLRRRTGLRARAASRLGWACEADESLTGEASRCHRLALELEPGNPYYLANLLGFELRCGATMEGLGGCMRPAILDAIRTCESHAAQELELPFAFFTEGRLRLLLGENEAALHEYLRGANYCLDEKTCCGPEVIDHEVVWLQMAHIGKPLPPPFQYAKDFLSLAKIAKGVRSSGTQMGAGALKARARIAGPVLIIAGGAKSIRAETLALIREPLTEALRDFCGTVISGGTQMGLPGLVGEITGKLRSEGRKQFTLLGYRPDTLRENAPAHPEYEQIHVGPGRFSETQILANWSDILAAGIPPAEVRMLGIGGGKLAAIEFRMALAIGATVGVLQIEKAFGEELDSVDRLLADPQWNGFTNLLPLPLDAKTLRMLVVNDARKYASATLDVMAKDFHERYREAHLDKIKPDALKPWERLPETYQTANRKQAAYAVCILEAAGFTVRDAEGEPKILTDFTDEEVEQMAEFEHGRWNIERLRDGWRPGPRDDARKTHERRTKDARKTHERRTKDARKTHDCIVPWRKLTGDREKVKRIDREIVRRLPIILAKAGLEIVRP